MYKFCFFAADNLAFLFFTNNLKLTTHKKTLGPKNYTFYFYIKFTRLYTYRIVRPYLLGYLIDPLLNALRQSAYVQL